MGARPIPILLYHSVRAEAPEAFAPWTVAPRQLEEHLDLLASRGVRTVTVSELAGCLARREEPDDGTVVVTFDDGFADFAELAWPALAARGLAATMYMTAGVIGARSRWLARSGAGDLPMLDAATLQSLAADGCEIGSHTLTHPELDCLSPRAMRREVADSKARLEDVLQRPVPSFAYPHGYHDEQVRRAVVDAGYSSACAVRNALSHPRDDRFALARFTVTRDVDAVRLAAVLDGAVVGPAAPHELVRTTVWRQVRRARHRLDGLRARRERVPA